MRCFFVLSLSLSVFFLKKIIVDLFDRSVGSVEFFWLITLDRC